MKRIALAVALLVSLAASAWAGLDEGLAAYERGDYVTAFQEFKPLAEQGDASAQYSLGMLYRLGRGVPQDDGEAMKWFRLAAEQGDAAAQYIVGLKYLTTALGPNDVEAAKWVRRAAEQGHAKAQAEIGFWYYLGQGVPQDYLLAHMWLNLAAAALPLGKDRDEAVEIRDTVANLMTPVLIVEAQKLARKWRPKSE